MRSKRTYLRLGLWGWAAAASLNVAWAQQEPPSPPAPTVGLPAPPAPTVAPPPATAVAGDVLSVRIETTSELTEADFLAALFRTLRRPLIVATADPPSDRPRLTVRFDSVQRELFVACYEPSRGTVTRVIDPPADPKAVPEAAALLADNLCTDQLEAPPKLPEPALVVPPAAPAPAPAAPPKLPEPAPVKPKPRPHLPVAAGVFYPLATNYEKPDVRTNFQFNLLYGRIGQLDGFSLGVVNAIEGNADGLTAALLVNRAGGRMSGLAAGGVNSFGSVDTGASFAFALNHSRGVVRGGQAALGLNFAGPVEGGQAAGLLNVASGDMQGLQAAFGANVASGDVEGAQFATILNFAGDVRGVQAALVNVAGHVRGMQLGLVNVAEEVEGVPLGFVNVTESGGVHLAAWAGFTTRANVGLKFATRYTYSMLTAGHYRAGERDAFGPGVVFGVRVPVHDEVSVAFDVGGDYLFGTRFCCYRDETEERVAHTRDRNHFRLRVLPTYQPKRYFALFAGGGVALKVPFAAYSGLDGYDQSVELEPELSIGVEL